MGEELTRGWAPAWAPASLLAVQPGGPAAGDRVTLQLASVLCACAPATPLLPAAPSCEHVPAGGHALGLLHAGVTPPELLFPDATLQREIP